MKKSVKIVLVILLIILILILIVAGIYLYIKNKCINDYNKSSLIAFKCMSLCPTREVPFDYNQGNQLILNADCVDYCVSLMDYSNNFCGRFAKFGEDLPAFKIWMNCGGTDNNNLANCLKEEVERYSDIVDLSGYNLRNYPKYVLSITNLTCSNGSADLTVTYIGDQQDVIVNILKVSIFQEEAISSGQTKTFHIVNAEIDSQSKISVSLGIQKDGEHHHLTISDKKSCQ